MQLSAVTQMTYKKSDAEKNARCTDVLCAIDAIAPQVLTILELLHTYHSRFIPEGVA
jgi:hypothetical protein